MGGNGGTHPDTPADVSAPFLELFRRAAEAHRLDPRLLWAVAMAESSLNPRAVSSAGAIGLMQLMPDTARLLGCRDPFDASQNVEAGARYLRQLLDQFGDIPLALAAYNAGPHVVERYGGIPPYPETQDYVKRVLRLRESAPDAWDPPTAPPQDPKVAEPGTGAKVARNSRDGGETTVGGGKPAPSLRRRWLSWWRRRG